MVYLASIIVGGRIVECGMHFFSFFGGVPSTRRGGLIAWLKPASRLAVKSAGHPLAGLVDGFASRSTDYVQLVGERALAVSWLVIWLRQPTCGLKLSANGTYRLSTGREILPPCKILPRVQIFAQTWLASQRREKLGKSSGSWRNLVPS